jgi:hypothetical protein
MNYGNALQRAVAILHKRVSYLCTFPNVKASRACSPPPPAALRKLRFSFAVK